VTPSARQIALAVKGARPPFRHVWNYPNVVRREYHHSQQPAAETGLLKPSPLAKGRREIEQLRTCA